METSSEITAIEKDTLNKIQEEFKPGFFYGYPPTQEKMSEMVHAIHFLLSIIEKRAGLSVSELVKDAYANAKEKGWHEKERSPLEYHALIHSEVSEATEAVRHGFPSLPIENTIIKPEGELIELADVIIRIADYCGSRGWDLEQAIKIKMEYNKTRPWRHDGKLY